MSSLARSLDVAADGLLNLIGCRSTVELPAQRAEVDVP